MTTQQPQFRLYHRKDGRVVKERDDLMSATRHALRDYDAARCQNSGLVRLDGARHCLSALGHLLMHDPPDRQPSMRSGATCLRN